ncbi:uncharacterized protein K452DRAFT_140420 [Aplosporella prunicola CBS 121167]|uniref:Velvet domain-containing protein n=1 Tax=Aplosporella prunicola CBS 121167 TaxID=1176127 RepID=A0A6A6AVY7_9PEZI|nr:uncharacterized protein K452DRAFT_140420 [Aplosporella prunicola CBS 121167]KAF2136172.1 hypothetical protein K452DRAFT_140420 [Aplosporella prunicola CBS 121167]
MAGNSMTGIPMYTYFPGPTFPPSVPLQPRAASASFEINRYDRSSSPSAAATALQQERSATTDRDVQISGDVTLSIRQQPKEALVCQDGKEKSKCLPQCASRQQHQLTAAMLLARKPVDPPPILQLKIRASADPQQHFMQSPYLFMCCCLVGAKDEEDQPTSKNGDNALAGTVVSSLHRLKDVDNHDGAFFVFGDISVKQLGQHRLRFSLFDLHKNSGDVVFLSTIISEPFRVVAPKDFRGMEESTYLSRAFSDQGVRLRLRKEPRTVMSGSKRSFYGENQKPTPTQPPAGTVTSSTSQYQTSDYHHGTHTEDDARINKRPKPDAFSSSPSNSLAVRAPNNWHSSSMHQQWPGNNGYGNLTGTGIQRTTDYHLQPFTGVTGGVPPYPASTNNLAPLLSPTNLGGRGYSTLGQRGSFPNVTLPGEYNSESIGAGLDDLHGFTGSEHQPSVDATADSTELKGFTDQQTPQSFTHAGDASVRGAVQSPEYMRAGFPHAYHASLARPQINPYEMYSAAGRGSVSSGFPGYNNAPMSHYQERVQQAHQRFQDQLPLSGEGDDGNIGPRHDLGPPYNPPHPEHFGETE